MEADRQASVPQQRVVEVAERKFAPLPSLLVGSQLEEQHLAEEIRKLVAGCVGIAAHLGPRIRLLEARVLDEEADRVVNADLAPVHANVEDDPARPPDRVRMHVQAEVGRIVEPLLAHQLLGVHGPPLDELGRVCHEARQRRVATAHR